MGQDLSWKISQIDEIFVKAFSHVNMPIARHQTRAFVSTQPKVVVCIFLLKEKLLHKAAETTKQCKFKRSAKLQYLSRSFPFSEARVRKEPWSLSSLPITQIYINILFAQKTDFVFYSNNMHIDSSTIQISKLKSTGKQSSFLQLFAISNFF